MLLITFKAVLQYVPEAHSSMLTSNAILGTTTRLATGPHKQDFTMKQLGFIPFLEPPDRR